MILSSFTYQSIPQIKFEEFKLGSGIKDTTDSAGKKIELYPDMPQWSGAELQEIKRLTSKVDSILNVESKQSLSKNENEIKKNIREAMLVRVFGQDHEVYYRSKLNEDLQLQAVLSILADKITYGSLLKPKVIGQADIVK